MKDYKVDKASLSETFRLEVYQVVCEIPLGKVSPLEVLLRYWGCLNVPAW